MPSDRDRRKERHPKYQDSWSPDRRRSFTPERKKSPAYRASKGIHSFRSRHSRSRSPRSKATEPRRRSSRDRSASRDGNGNSTSRHKRKRRSPSHSRAALTTSNGELFPTNPNLGGNIPGLDVNSSPDHTSNAPALTLDDELLSEETYLFGKQPTPPPKKNSLCGRYEQQDINVMSIHNKGKKPRTKEAVDDDSSTKEFSSVTILDMIHSQKSTKKLSKGGIFDRNEIHNFVLIESEEPKIVRLIPSKDDLKKLEAKLSSKSKSEGSGEKKKSKKKDKEKDRDKRAHSQRDSERRRSKERERRRESSLEKDSRDRDGSPKIISLDKADAKRTAATDPYIMTDDDLTKDTSRDYEDRQVIVEARLDSEADKFKAIEAKKDLDLRQNINQKRYQGGRPFKKGQTHYGNSNQMNSGEKDICHEFQSKYGCHRPICRFVHITKVEREYIKETGKLPDNMPGYIKTQMSDKLIAKVRKEVFVRIDYEHKNPSITERLGQKSGVPDFPTRSDLSRHDDRPRHKDNRPKVRDLRSKFHERVDFGLKKPYKKEPERWSHDKYDELEKEKEGPKVDKPATE